MNKAHIPESYLHSHRWARSFRRCSPGAVGDKLKNWAGNVEYSTENLYAATGQDLLKGFVKRHAKLKVLGSRHCF